MDRIKYDSPALIMPDWATATAQGTTTFGSFENPFGAADR